MKFSQSKDDSRPAFQDAIANRISKGAEIQGEVKSETDIRVDGVIKGILNCAAKVVVGQTGSFEGELKCKEASIEGNVTGKVEVNGLLYLKKTAHIEGEVFYKKLIVEEGANISGTITMSGGTTKSLVSEKVDQVKKDYSDGSQQKSASYTA